MSPLERAGPPIVAYWVSCVVLIPSQSSVTAELEGLCAVTVARSPRAVEHGRRAELALRRADLRVARRDAPLLTREHDGVVRAVHVGCSILGRATCSPETGAAHVRG